MTEEVRFILSADDAKAAAALKRTEDGIKRVGSATAYTKQQMQQLSFQLTDIVSGLATGQSPFMILMQQGGQLRDSFGGLGGAVRALSSVFTTARLAIGGGAAAVGSFAVAAKQAYQEDRELARSLALTGGAAGLTADSFKSLAEQISAVTEGTIGDAKKALNAAIATGAFGPQAVGVAAQAMERLQRLSGATSEDVQRQFAGMQGGVAKWAAETNRSYNYLSVSQFKYIQRLEQQGKADEAALETVRLLNDELGVRLARTLNDLEKAWAGVESKASAAWAAMGGAALRMVQGESLAEKYDRLRNELAVASTPGGGPLTDASRAKRLPGIESDLNTTGRDLIRQMEAATTKAYEAMANQQGIASLIKAAKAPTARPRTADPSIGPPTFDEQYPFPDISGILAYQRDNAWSQGHAFGDISANADGGDDYPMWGGNQAFRRHEIGQYGETDGYLQRQAEETVERNRWMAEQLKPEWQKLAESWDNTTDKMAEVGKRFTDGFVNAGRDAFDEFMRTGRLSAEGFKQVFLQTLTDMIYDRIIAKQMGKLADVLWGYLGNAFLGGGGWASGSGSGGSGGTNYTGMDEYAGIAGTRAGGGSVMSGRTYLVGERGPELLRMGAGGGWIVPNHQMRGASGASVVINQTLNVGQGVARAEVYQAMVLAKDSAVGEIKRQIDRGNRFFDR